MCLIIFYSSWLTFLRLTETESRQRWAKALVSRFRRTKEFFTKELGKTLLFAKSDQHNNHREIEESSSFARHEEEHRQKAEGHEEKEASNNEKDGKAFVAFSISLQVFRFLSQSVPPLLDRGHDAIVFLLFFVSWFFLYHLGWLPGIIRHLSLFVVIVSSMNNLSSLTQLFLKVWSHYLGVACLSRLLVW